MLLHRQRVLRKMPNFNNQTVLINILLHHIYKIFNLWINLFSLLFKLSKNFLNFRSHILCLRNNIEKISLIYSINQYSEKVLKHFKINIDFKIIYYYYFYPKKFLWARDWTRRHPRFYYSVTGHIKEPYIFSYINIHFRPYQVLSIVLIWILLEKWLTNCSLWFTV